MKVFYPALVTSAIFFGAIVLNLYVRDYSTVLFTSLLAIPAILIQVLLSQRNFDIVGYLLILVPIILVIVGYSIGVHNPSSGTTTTTTVKFTPSESCSTENFISIINDRVERKMT